MVLSPTPVPSYAGHRCNPGCNPAGMQSGVEWHFII